MTCPRKTLNNFKCLPTPPTLGTDGQLIVSDGNEGTRFSTSLLRDQPAVVSSYVSSTFLIPATSIAYPLIPGGIDGGMIKGDASATTARGLEVFNPTTGGNNTDQQIMVQVSYSVSWAPNNNGFRSIWLQITDGLSPPKMARYGLAQTQGTNAGNAMTGATVIGLMPGEFAVFYVTNTSAQAVGMLGGDILTQPLITKFQSALIN